MSEWKTMDSAPKDGRQIQVFCADGQFATVEYHDNGDGSGGWEFGHNERYHFTLRERALAWAPINVSNLRELLGLKVHDELPEAPAPTQEKDG